MAAIKADSKGSGPTEKRKSNMRRYNPDWELSYSWVTSVVKDEREVPFCNVCAITLSTHRSCLNKHGNSMKHNEIANRQKQAGTLATPKPKPAKRGLIVSFKNSHNSNLKSSRSRLPSNSKPKEKRKIESEGEVEVEKKRRHSDEKDDLSLPTQVRNENILDQLEDRIDEDDPNYLIIKLCKLMYELGWATGTGGGVSVKQGECLYMAPSGIAKEMVKAEDIFVTDISGNMLSRPTDTSLRLTQCAPLFMNAYLMRDAGAVIHSHSKYAVLATLMCKGNEFSITHLEMIKGIKKATTGLAYNYDEVLKIPIIENTLFEKDLKNRMQVAMDCYPDTNAVLVRRHGVYVWGPTWHEAKAMAECYHYLFEVAYEMNRMGIKFDVEPTDESGFTD